MESLKKSELGFAEGFLGIRAMASKGNRYKVFDWDKAANIIKDKLKNHPDLKAEAGLQGDWAFTGGVIFCDGKPTDSSYTYLGSVWATPSLILSWDEIEQEEVECFSFGDECRFDENSKWDDDSLKILGISR